jgi:hypothetical protein
LTARDGAASQCFTPQEDFLHEAMMLRSTDRSPSQKPGLLTE